MDVSKRLNRMLFVARKDWKEIKSNKQIIIPMAVIPLLFAVIYPILMIVLPLYGAGSTDFSDFEMYLPGRPGIEGFLYFFSDLMIKPYFTFIPLILTMVISSDSWAGEKERKTAESLLLLPLSDKDLFLAKVLASLIPGLLITWACGLMTFTIIDIAAFPILNRVYLPNLSWLYILFILVPILSFFSIFINVLVSTRAKDVKSAQQLGGSVITIGIGLLFAGFTGLIDITIILYTIIFSIVDIVLIYISPKVFSRERLVSAI
ncbi:MAG: ABC transporter permease subunit [Promethearchaeota archaeon]